MEAIQDVVKRKISKKYWRHSKSIAAQIICIEMKAKLGFLFDFWNVNANDLLDLLIELRREHIVKCDLILLEVGNDDVIILNLTSFEENANDRRILIDVSSNLSEPKIISDFNRDLESVKNQILNFSKRPNPNENIKLKLNLTQRDCIPTVFGYLIGYPVLYYINPEITDDDNCLSNVDLKVFQIFYREILLISFTAPLQLYSENLKSLVENWLDFYRKSLNEFRIELDVKNYPRLVL